MQGLVNSGWKGLQRNLPGHRCCGYCACTLLELAALSRDLFSFRRRETKNIFRRLHFKCLELTTAPERSEMSAQVLLCFSAHACAFQHLHMYSCLLFELFLPRFGERWFIEGDGNMAPWPAGGWGRQEKNVRDAAEHSSWWVSAQRTETVPPCRHFSGH